MAGAAAAKSFRPRSEAVLRWPLVAPSRRHLGTERCPLPGGKRTYRRHVLNDANDPKRTLEARLLWPISHQGVARDDVAVELGTELGRAPQRRVVDMLQPETRRAAVG